jgi:phosphocarrier protein
MENTANMVQKQFRIRNELGLHLRAAGEFVKEASKYPCDIFVQKDDVKVNAKSIMSVLTLIAGKDSNITIMAEGARAEEAVENLGKLVLNGFGEK